MPAKFFSLLAVSSLAMLACSVAPVLGSAISVNTVSGSNYFGNSPVHAFPVNEKRGRRRCNTRHSSSPKPTTQPAPPSPTSKSPSYGGKVGLAWAVNDDTALSHFVTPHVGVITTWSPWIPDNARSLGLKACPMFWGPKQIDDFKKLVKPGYANCVLGFNEPNQPGQSDLDPYYAAQLWKQYIQPLKDQGYILISPACTNDPSGKIWMHTFMKSCDDCTFDGLAVHFYGTDPKDMINHLQDMHATFNLPIWPTEFACQNFGAGAQCSMDQVWNFMKTVKNFMDNTEWVPHYFAFGTLYDMANVNENNRLLGTNGYPTDLGQFYISSG